MHKRRNKKMLGWALSGVLVSLLVGFLVSVSGSYKVYVVHTGSMTPTISPRSAVLVHTGHYHVGQVIAFHTSAGVVTHRLVGGVLGSSGDASLTTKGDGNKTNDPTSIKQSDVVGGVVAAPRALGYWLIYLKNPLGAGSVLFTVICIGLIWSIASESSSLDTSTVNADPNSGSSTTQRRHRGTQRRALPVAAYDTHTA